MLFDSNRLYFDHIQISDTPFIESLFSNDSVRKFYVLRDDHAANLKSFVTYLTQVNQRQSGIELIMRLKSGMPIGLIGAELFRDRTSSLAWNTAYAVVPKYWNQGYATEALNAFTAFIKQYTIPISSLDISDDNEASVRVAQKAGYQRNRNTAHFDPQHMDVGVLFHWEKALVSARDRYYTMAVEAFQAKDFRTAETYFERALQEAYEPGTPNTDAICYSNMGMACTSYGNYHKAYQCLKKAQSLGLDNPSIQRELQWLRINQGIG